MFKDKAEFNIGDFVYISDGNDIGQVTDVNERHGGGWNYRVNYCQFKDPDRGIVGGNGPVFREGYPKKVTEPIDVLFVAARKERAEIERLRSKVESAENNFEVLKKALNILRSQHGR